MVWEFGSGQTVWPSIFRLYYCENLNWTLAKHCFAFKCDVFVLKLLDGKLEKFEWRISSFSCLFKLLFGYFVYLRPWNSLFSLFRFIGLVWCLMFGLISIWVCPADLFRLCGLLYIFRMNVPIWIEFAVLVKLFLHDPGWWIMMANGTMHHAPSCSTTFCLSVYFLI